MNPSHSSVPIVSRAEQVIRAKLTTRITQTQSGSLQSSTNMNLETTEFFHLPVLLCLAFCLPPFMLKLMLLWLVSKTKHFHYKSNVQHIIFVIHQLPGEWFLLSLDATRY